MSTSTAPATVAIVYHSGYGHTERQAQAVADGARSVDGTAVHLLRVDDLQDPWRLLEGADAIIFGAPTYMGSASAGFKAFMEATSPAAYAKALWKDKIAAGFTNSASRSGDKVSTLQQLAIFAAQHGMHWVNLGLQPGHSLSSSTEDSLNRHGFFLGAAAQSNGDEGPDVAPPQADLRTAHHLGRRVALVARQMRAGGEELRRSAIAD